MEQSILKRLLKTKITMEEKEIKKYYRCNECGDIINEEGDYVASEELPELQLKGYSFENLHPIDYCIDCAFWEEEGTL
jgi:uncharacterized protein with PIN domain